ncbi:hypothetical protein C0J52_10620 [Blattella germanica]|nr:hypothetical protein C0J52_10620 [Blattella germanica]
MEQIKREPLSPESSLDDSEGDDDTAVSLLVPLPVEVKIEPGLEKDTDNCAIDLSSKVVQEKNTSKVLQQIVKEEPHQFPDPKTNEVDVQLMGAQTLCEVSYGTNEQPEDSNGDSEDENTDSSESSNSKQKAEQTQSEPTNPYECEICKELYPTQKQINVFCVVHKGARPYQCDVCSKTFVLRTNLNFHYRTHSTENLYVCDICNKSFRHQGKLNDHYDVHTGLETFDCPLCDKRFRRTNQLKYHLQNHSRTYECDVCKKRFARKSSLREHCLQHIYFSQKYKASQQLQQQEKQQF